MPSPVLPPTDLDRLCERLRALPAGGVDILSRSRFLELFGAEGSRDDMKDAASRFGQGCGCQAVFLGGEDIYVCFQAEPRHSASTS
jgi:hypothetical protein